MLRNYMSLQSGLLFCLVRAEQTGKLGLDAALEALVLLQTLVHLVQLTAVGTLEHRRSYIIYEAIYELIQNN